MDNRFYIRRAMAVDPRVLEKDFETDVDLDTIAEIYLSLKDKELKDLGVRKLKRINKFLSDAWFGVDHKQGISLRDREKLYPVFSELNRILKGRDVVPLAYRGVKLSRFDGFALSRTYPNSIKDPVVIEHLENLAYGLRSWSTKLHWALKYADHSTQRGDKRDQVIFKIETPNVVLDSKGVHNVFKGESILDSDEVVLYLKGPKIKNIEWDGDDESRLFYVTVSDAIS